MTEDNPEFAWSVYWAQDRLHSCIASENPDDERLLNAEWEEFAAKLPAAARVLDLATGNGAVPKALLATRSDLQIDAVDRAMIDPMKFLSDGGDLEKVRFHPQTDILELPFAAQSFDAITSQFGIEYATLTRAAPRVSSLLKPDGKLLFLTHHAESQLIVASQPKKRELERLIEPRGLLAVLHEIFSGNSSLSELEACGARYLEGKFVKTAAISGQVFEGINRIIELFERDINQARQLASNMDFRVRAEHQRLSQMIESAQTARSLDELSVIMDQHGVSIQFEPLYVESGQSPYLLCWSIQGQK